MSDVAKIAPRAREHHPTLMRAITELLGKKRQDQELQAALAEVEELKVKWAPIIREYLEPRSIDLNVAISRAEAAEGLAREMLGFLRDRQGRKGVWLAATDDFSEKARKIGLLPDQP